MAHPAHRPPDPELLAATVRALTSGREAPDRPALRRQLDSDPGPVYLAFRCRGQRVCHLWTAFASRLEALERGIAEARAAATEADAADGPDTVELCLAHSFRRLDLADRRQRPGSGLPGSGLPGSGLPVSAHHRGVWGFELRHGDEVALASPTAMIAENRDLDELLRAFAERQGIPPDEIETAVVVRCFESRQYLIRLAEEGATAPLLRGQRTVPTSEVRRRTVEVLERQLGDFLLRAVSADGRMVYRYLPSRGAEDRRQNNMIRQWMATLALCRTATYRGDGEASAVAKRNIRYNLRHFYRAEDGLGLIGWRGTVKLGAVALAALALRAHPDRDELRPAADRLAATVEHLARADGSFATFYRPAGRRGGENYYPGEAQLTRAHEIAETGDPALLERFMRSFRFYRAWHLENRHPAFVPWHTQACFEVWKVTRDAELGEFIYQSNDWLLGMQQWDSAVYSDLRGRFYDPRRPRFGPPHASSTGVYLEGLADAFRLARELGDGERRERYRRAIVRGLRSVLQLTFRDRDDMYYVRDPDFLRGAVRTTVYDNVVRIDNVQHNQLAVLKVLRCFGERDFVVEG